MANMIERKDTLTIAYEHLIKAQLILQSGSMDEKTVAEVIYWISASMKKSSEVLNNITKYLPR